MKKILFIILIFFSLKSISQKKSYELIINASGINSYTKSKIINQQAVVLIDSTGAFVILLGGRYPNDINKSNYKSRLSYSITMGGRLNYCPLKNWSFSIGSSLTFSEVMREKHHFQSQTRSYTDTTYGYSLTGGTVIILPGTYTNSFEDKSNETFRFISLNIPLTINYFYKKWQFEAGIIPSILISTKEKKDNSKKDPEMAFISPEVQFSNTQKSTFDLCISPTYKLCKNICLGIEYKYGLSNILISEKYSDLKLRCLGIKILYKL